MSVKYFNSVITCTPISRTFIRIFDAEPYNLPRVRGHIKVFFSFA